MTEDLEPAMIEEAHADEIALAPGSETDGEPVAHFPVVGIGASAGGLAALQRLFAHMPADSGMAFVVVTHLMPARESHLAAILQRHTAMPVQQVTKTVPLARNQVYVIPPNYNLATIDTHLRLSQLEVERRARAPIDHFFRTLATTHAAQAIGIILSGVGAILCKRSKKDGSQWPPPLPASRPDCPANPKPVI